MNLFITNEIINIEMVQVIIYKAIMIYAINLVIWYIVNMRLQKRVNVD